MTFSTFFFLLPKIRKRKIGAKFVLTIGENELENGKAGLKRMSDGVVSDVELTAESIANALIG